MNTINKISTGLIVAAMVSGGMVAFCQDAGSTQQTQRPTPDIFPGLTNQVVTPTPDYFTNSQAAISADQQYRVSQEGAVGKGATALQHGPRIEPRPPSGFLQADPWVQPDHPWDFYTNSPDITPP